jgi:hypothetical protein
VKIKESLGEGKPVVAPTHQGKKGNKNYIELHASYLKPRVVHPPRKLPSQRFVPRCHHCGKMGHIRPHYFNLKPHVQINKREKFTFNPLSLSGFSILTLKFKNLQSIP